MHNVHVDESSMCLKMIHEVTGLIIAPPSRPPLECVPDDGPTSKEQCKNSNKGRLRHACHGHGQMIR